MNIFIAFFIGLVIAYFLCGIPFALIIGKVFFKTDPRKFGSGNLGATNTLRTLGVRAGILVLFLDGLKGYLSVMIMRALMAGATPSLVPAPDWALIGALLAAVLGHVFSPYLDFKGGKGVATAAGAMFAMQPIAAFICLAVFVVVVALTRYVSLGSITIAALYPFLVLIFYRTPVYVVCAFALATLVIMLHRSNITRLQNGTESKVSFSSRIAQSHKNQQ